MTGWSGKVARVSFTALWKRRPPHLNGGSGGDVADGVQGERAALRVAAQDAPRSGIVSTIVREEAKEDGVVRPALRAPGLAGQQVQQQLRRVLLVQLNDQVPARPATAAQRGGGSARRPR